MTDYWSDREWSDRLLSDVQSILSTKGDNWITAIASDHLDQTRATDLVCDIGHIAVRIRSPGFLHEYPWDFTIRSLRKSGAETELSKIQRGFADFLFYGHALDERIVHWWLINLAKFRSALSDIPLEQLGSFRLNNDGSTGFWAFNIRRFPHTQPPLLTDMHRRMAKKAVKLRKQFEFVAGLWP